MTYRFADPAAFHYLWILPLLFVITWYLVKQSQGKLQRALGAKLAPFLLASVSQTRRWWKLVLKSVVLALFVFALARPQSGESEKKVKSEGVEVMLLVDVSRSMMAEDTKPSRLKLAKKELSRLIDRMDGDKVGLIAFAGSAILLSPLTPDKPAVKMFLDSLSPEAVKTQGTDFRKALAETSSAFSRGGVESGEQSVVTKVVVIASDGEDNEPGAIEAASELAEKGVRIFTLGFGTEKGAPIPVRDGRGNLRGYKKDKSGKKVVSKTKGTVLKNLASEGKGSFHHVTFGGNAIKSLHKEIQKLEQTEFESAEMTDYDENYQMFLLFGLILALGELFLKERASAARFWRGRFEVGK
ncbi:MAG: VWA domain-containing protein [Bdellovibrionales bacterium]|nr:VWA domain-containing protein [Bdellovibrionales bacterium]